MDRFLKMKLFKMRFNMQKNHDSNLHIFGLVSDGGVHSYTTHIMALHDLAKSKGVTPYLHAFMDGRDTPQTSGLGYLKDLMDHGLQVATVSGRYYAMDRDNNWDRIQKAFDNMVLGTGSHEKDALIGIQKSYDAGITDEFIEPFVVIKMVC
jgi:2,3-bisphosphoglycerate-independent phosphoglycerate mutase